MAPAEANSDSFELLLRSSVFTFYIGPEKVPIAIHAAAVSKQSASLNALINGSMTEAQTQSAYFKNVEMETFVLFCQFAYKGDYETPSCAVQEEDRVNSDRHSVGSAESTHAEKSYTEEEPEPAPQSPTSRTADLIWGRPGKSSKKKKSKKTLLREEFDSRRYNLPSTEQIFKDACATRSNNGPEEDFTPVFLGHARVYAFAEKYGIETLKQLSLDKLHKTLAAFTLHEARIGDIIQLARFVYFDDSTPDRDHNIDELRALVVHYMICEKEILSPSTEFLSLLEDGGSFVRDFWLEMYSHFF